MHPVSIPSPIPRQQKGLLSVSINWPLDIHISRLTQYVVLFYTIQSFASIFSSSVMFLRLIYVAHVSVLLFSLLNITIFLYRHTTFCLSIHQIIDFLIFFWFLFTMKNAAINIWVQTFFFFNDSQMFFLLLNIYLFWLCWVFIAARGLYLVGASGGYSLVVECRLLIALASLIAGRGL